VITRLWREFEKISERKSEHKKKKRKLQVLLSVLLVAPAGALMLLERLSLITSTNSTILFNHSATLALDYLERFLQLRGPRHN
jgi:hypothetical protein